MMLSVGEPGGGQAELACPTKGKPSARDRQRMAALSIEARPGGERTGLAGVQFGRWSAGHEILRDHLGRARCRCDRLQMVVQFRLHAKQR